MTARVNTTDGTPVGTHPVLAALAGVRAALSEAAMSDSCWSLSEAEVVAAVGEVLAVRSVTEAMTATLVGQAETRGIYTQVAATSTTGWLRRRFQVSLTEARRLTALASALPRWAQATADERTRGEALLVTQAQTLDPGELALCGQALKEALTVTPDVDDPDEAERAAKAARDAAAREAGEWERRAVRLIRRRDGMLGITGTLDALTGALVREILEDAARPADAVEGVTDERSPGQRLADALTELITTGSLDLDDDPGMTTPSNSMPDTEHPTVEDPSIDPEGCCDAGDLNDLDVEDPHSDLGDFRDVGDAGEPMLDFGDRFTVDPDAATTDPGTCGPDARDDHDATGTGSDCCAGANRAHRRARKRPSTARPGVTVSLIVDWEKLRAGLAGGSLPDGTTLSPAATLAALCDAGIIPMIFNGPGRPLHVGRYRREFTPAQRRALAARDRGCTFPGCRRRASGCAAHHLKHWENGGSSDLDNGALLCRYHHQVLHREGWEGRLDARGRPEYRPPAAVDPERRPRQHLRFATAT